MSDVPTQSAAATCCEQFAFTRCFRVFGMSYNWNQLLLAFAGVALTFVGGKTLDGMTPKSSQVLVVNHDGIRKTELNAFVDGSAKDMQDWIQENAHGSKAHREGIFLTMMQFYRVSIAQGINAVTALNPSAFFGVILNGFKALGWLFINHQWFALFQFLYMLIIWSLFGGAVARVAALRATRDERITMSTALAFARSRFMSFFMAPLMPMIALGVAGLALFVGGMVGAIPWLGELLVGALFFLALIAGFVIAFIVVGIVAGGSLLFPTLAVEGSDAFDAMSRTFAYVYQRPWKTGLYTLASAAYVAICLVFAKLFVRIMLVAVHLFVGASMNWGAPMTHDKTVKDLGKLNAIWSAPSISGNIPMVGTFDDHKLSNATWLSQCLIEFWVYIVWSMVAALAISMFFSSSTIIYLLLRREVDATDLEEVYEEGAMDEPLVAPSSASPPKSSGTSLPVIGS